MQATGGATPLMYACQQCRENEVLEILKKQPYSVNDRDRTSKTPLHYCAENPNSSCAETLLKARPELVNAQDENGYCTLHLAVIAGNKPLIKLLIAKGANVNIHDNEGHSAVHWAIVSSEKEALETIIRAGADPSTPDIHGGYPLHYAVQMCGCSCGHARNSEDAVRVVETLLNFGVDVNVKDKDGRQPILWAASAGSADAVIHLISGGACVEAADKDGLTALHCAASRGHTTALETLITLCGANVDVIDANGCSALFYSVTLGHADATQLLLQLGAEPNRQDRKGRTPAHCGAAKGQLETLRILKKHGGNLWMRNVKGDIPLHEAVASGRKDLVLWLLSQYPEAINIANNDGRCPLHIAAMYNNTEMVKILLDSKCLVNPVMRTSKGVLMTPLNVALSKGHRSCGKYLQLHGGVPFSKVSQTEPPQGLPVRVSPFDDVIETEEKVKEGGTVSHISKSRSSTDFHENQEVVRTESTDKKKVYRRRKRKKNTSNVQVQDSDSDDSIQDLKTAESRKKGKSGEVDDENDEGQTLKVQSDTSSIKKTQNMEKSSAKSDTSIKKKDVLEEHSTTGKTEKAESKSLIRNKSFNETKNVSDLSPEDFPPLMQTINQLDTVIMENDIDGRKTETENNESKQEIVRNDETIEMEKKEEAAVVGEAPPREEEKLQGDEKTEKESSFNKEKSGKTLAEKKQNGGNQKHESAGKPQGRKISDESSVRKSVKTSKSSSDGSSGRKDPKTTKKLVGGGNGNHTEVNGKNSPEKASQKTTSNATNTKDLEVEKLGDSGTSFDKDTKELEKSETEKLKKESEDSKADTEKLKKEPEASVAETEKVKEESEASKGETEKVKEPEAFKGEIEKMKEEPEASKAETEELKKEPEESKAETKKLKEELKTSQAEPGAAITETEKLKTEFGDSKTEHGSPETESKNSAPEVEVEKKTESKDLAQEVTKSETETKASTEVKNGNGLAENLNNEIPKQESSGTGSVALGLEVEGSKPPETQVFPEEVIKKETLLTAGQTQEKTLQALEGRNLTDPNSAEAEENIKKLPEVFLSENQIPQSTSEINSNATEADLTGGGTEKEERKPNKEDVPRGIKKRSADGQTAIEKPEEERETVERSATDRTEAEGDEDNKNKKEEPEVEPTENEQGDELDVAEGEDSSCSPQKRMNISKIKTHKVSRLCRRNKDSKDDANQISVTQLVQNTIRKYHMERGIFYQLLELKRYQIRSGKANEQVLVKRLADEYESSRVFLGMKPFSGLYKFKEFEKFLYDQLKALNARRSFIVPDAKSYDDIDALSAVLKKSRYKIISETPPPEMVCTCITQRCHHSACAYTSVPCSAYVTDLRHHKHHRPKRESFFPRIEQKPDTQRMRERPATLELIQGSEKHVITLPQNSPTRGKRYFVTFTIKGAPALKDEDFVEESNDHLKHRHAKSV